MSGPNVTSVDATLDGHTNAKRAAVLIAYGLCAAPLFLLTVRGWGNWVLVAGALLCVGYLLILPSGTYPTLAGTEAANWARKLFVLAMVLPMLTIAVSSLARSSVTASHFDTASRFVVALAIFYFAVRSRMNAARILQWLVPVALLITLGQQFLVEQPHLWGNDRMATYFADPLVFGYVSLCFALMCLVSIRAQANFSPWLLVLKLLGIAIGLYLSVMSGSRTGWLALPVVLGAWLYQQRGSQRPQALAALGLTVLALPLILYFATDLVRSRANMLFDEVAGYTWSGIAQETPVGFRITYLRIAWDLFLEHPWFGVGTFDFMTTYIPTRVLDYASDEALLTALGSGFHNEVVTNAIRFGVFAALASVALFVVPLWLFAKNLHNSNIVVRANSMLGFTVVVVTAFGSLSTEVFDLKTMASFYALMVAVLAGSTLAHHEQD